MELIELKKRIEEALSQCSAILENQPEIVLSEADFERLVSWSIMVKLGQNDYRKPQQSNSFTVHTQISHYLNDSTRADRRVDILLLTNEGMKNAKNNKEFKYEGDSFALELKYFRAIESSADVKRKIRCDFCKRRDLESNSWLYVVALIESDDENDYNEKQVVVVNQLQNEIRSGNHEDDNNLFCKILRKKIVNWDNV